MSTTRALSRRLRHVFITPDLQGPPTGGTLFNAALIDALNRAGVSSLQYAFADGLAAVDRDTADVYWVDSLYLDNMCALRARTPDARLNLVLHYLPSLVSHAAQPDRAVHELTDAERLALDAASGFLVTSPFMQRQLRSLGLGTRSVLCVEPGVAIAPVPGRSINSSPRALMLCNLTEGKGVLELLLALAERVRSDDAFALDVVGRVDMSPRYAEQCASTIAAHPELNRRVRLLGGVKHPQALALLRRADLLLSASQMESYGMALSEARAAGVPIVARVGGHAAAHVDAESGGVLVSDEAAVADRFLDLVREPKRLEECQRRARSAIVVRSWDDAAAELIAQL